MSFGAESEFNLQRLTEEPVLFASVSWVSLGKKAASKVKHSQFEAPPLVHQPMGYFMAKSTM